MNTSWWTSLKEWTRRHWKVLRKILTVCFVALVLSLLGLAVGKIDWNEVIAAIHKLPAKALWTAAIITAISYALYSTFDLIGKSYTEHALAYWRVAMVGFISYAFTMSMGAPVGGLGLRLRLYAKQGLQQGVIMRIMGMSLATNWIGYTLIAGTVFAAGVLELPPSWKLDNGPLRVIGAVMVVAVIAYLGLCAFSRKRAWTVFGHEIELPSIGMAVLQLALGIVNWMLIGAVIFVLLQQHIPYFVVLSTLLLSAIAGALAHIPGGIGVTESVFVALLGDSMGRAEILGGLLVFRAIYYVAPLLLAGAWYLGTEVKMRKFTRHINCSPK